MAKAAESRAASAENGRFYATREAILGGNGRAASSRKSRPRTTSRDDVLDYGSVDMSDPNNSGWFRVARDSAAAALEGAGPNRVGYKADVAEYAAAMMSGDWRDYSGSPFYCDKQGRLRRGFHRARAVIVADAEIIVRVECGVAEDEIEVDDLCKPWTTHDHMTQKTGDPKKSLAETVFNARIVIGLERPIKGRRQKALACGGFYDENKDIFSGIEEKLANIPDRSIRKAIRLASIQVAFHELAVCRPDLSGFVMDAMANIEKGAARNFQKLINKCYLRGGGGPAMKDHYAWTKYAIVKFVNGQTITGDNWALDSNLATMSAHKMRRGRGGDAGEHSGDLPGQTNMGW